MTDTVSTVRLVIPGDAVGKARPRVTRQGAYTPAKTKHAERDVRSVWREAGSPRLPDGPIALHVHFFTPRPASHFTSKGALSAVGQRTPFPVRRPDIDNQIKLLTDALNGLSYRDDAQIVELHARRRWSDDGRGWTVMTLLVKTPQVDAPASVVELHQGADDPDGVYASQGEYPVLGDLNQKDAA